MHYVNQIGLFWENKAIEYQPLSTGRHIVSKINGKINLYRPLLDTKKKFLVKISKNIFGGYIKDPSNKNLKYLFAKAYCFGFLLCNTLLGFSPLRCLKNTYLVSMALLTF